MANYTCEFSKIKDGDSTKYVQVPNENTAKRDTLVFADDFNHTPLRNLDKYKISCQETVVVKGEDKNVTVTYYRDFKSDQKGVVTGDGSGTDFIFCAFKQEEDNDDDVIYIKHDDLTNAENDNPNGKYPVWTLNKDKNVFVQVYPPAESDSDATTYTFGWL